MKKLFALLFIGCMLLNISCEDDGVIAGGDLAYDEIFVWEDGELVLAHKYGLNFPAQGGVIDVKIVSPGMHYRTPLTLANQFVVELLDSIDENPESYIYDYVEEKMMNGTIKRTPRYLQTLRITAERNKRSGSRRAKLDIQTSTILGFDGARAIITLRQAGAK